MQQTHHYTQPKNKHLHINSKQQHTVKLGASMMAATTTTSRSTKLKNFIWNKLASVRKQSTSSINLGPSVPISSPSGGQIDPQTDSSSSLSEKKQRRNIFHLFESSSKMKLNTGSSKKSATKSPKHSSVDSSPSKLSSPEKSPRKTPTPNLTDNNNLSINPATSTASSSPAKSIASTPSRVSSRGGGSGTELVTPEIESVKVNLIDNSMVKSKIHAASRRVNARKQPPTVSVATNNNGLLSSTSSNVNYSSFKNSLTELSCNSLNNNLRIIDMFGDDEPSLLLTQDGYTEKMDVSTTEKSSGIELKPIQLSTTSSSSSSSSSQRAGSRQHSQSQSGKFMMNTSRSIESSSSLTTNLLEINEDMHNVDLFSAGAHFGPPPHFNQSKSLFDCDHHESKENIFSHVRSPMRKPINSNSNNMKSEEYIKLDPIEVINEEEGSTKNSNNIKKKLHSKTIIYDNNFTNHHYGTTASCQRQQKISTSSIDSSFYSSSQGTDFKSKSCERLNSATSNNQSPPTIPNPNQTAVESINSKIDYSKNNGQSSVDNNNFDCMNSNKKLNYSKSLKLVQQPLINNSNANNKPGWVPASNKLGGNLNDRTNIIGPNKQPPYVNNLKKFNETTNNEPSWKELAHRKHTAWSQKNLERKPSESQNNRPDTNKIDEKTEEVINQPTEGKVKSMISKFA